MALGVDPRRTTGYRRAMMSDDDRTLRMLTMRSWRRGMREMDLLLGPFAEAALPSMPAADRATYAELLEENDQDLYAWVVAATDGRSLAPARFAALIDQIAESARARADCKKF